MSRRPDRWLPEVPATGPFGSPTPLLPQRAFVVHLRDGVPAGARMAGRVEHVVSGRIAEFACLAELRRFMARMAGRDDREGTPPRTPPATFRERAPQRPLASRRAGPPNNP